MRRRFLALAAALPVLLVGCSAPSHHSSDPPSSVSPTSGPNPDVVPTVITPAYVNAVFAVLNHINGNAVRAALAANAVTPTVEQDLRAIYSPPLLSAEQQVFESGLTQDRLNLRSAPGDRQTRVRRILSAGSSCIFVLTSSDLSAVELRPSASPASEYWELKTKSASDDPAGLNPTPWTLSFNQDYETPTSISDPC